MKLRQLFIFNLFIAFPIALMCIIFPVWTFGLYDLVPDPGSIWVTRLIGGSILGYASLMWFGSKSDAIKTRRAIALALLIQDSFGLLASLEIQFSGKMNFLGWPLNVLTYGLLALGYAYFTFIKLEKC